MCHLLQELVQKTKEKDKSCSSETVYLAIFMLILTWNVTQVTEKQRNELTNSAAEPLEHSGSNQVDGFHPPITAVDKNQKKQIYSLIFPG